MTWNNLLFDPLPPTVDLPSAIDQLFSRQREDWPMFRRGEAALASIRTKQLSYEGASILIQANPGRIRSTHARIDPQSVADRNCFLCPEYVPAEEMGIGFGQLVILPNPYPILPYHCTIPDRMHRPQRLQGHLENMLELARHLGPEMLVFYNGPRCGASAPDHFHFQACHADGVPLLDQLPITDASSRQVTFESFGRRMFVCVDAHEAAVQTTLERTLKAMRAVTKSDEEPMLNLLVFHRQGRFVSVLFPRARHRPACYFKEGAGRLAISPAALEMAGVLVVAELDHFDLVDAESAYRIYTEVSLDEESFLTIAKAVT